MISTITFTDYTDCATGGEVEAVVNNGGSHVTVLAGTGRNLYVDPIAFMQRH
jgi:hypothetical protein